MKEQHGFQYDRSAVTNFSEFANFVAKSLNARNDVHTIYTHFSKAFDSNDHCYSPNSDRFDF